MKNLSDLELTNIKKEAESAEEILTRAIELAEEKKTRISCIIDRVQDEQDRREDLRVTQRMKVL